jgi:diacylglycerol kinase family enzyme
VPTIIIFINAAVAGLGAQVTAETPNELKDFLGGGAYTLIGLAKALGFKPYQGSINTEKAPWMAILWSAPFVIISRRAADKCLHLRH